MKYLVAILALGLSACYAPAGYSYYPTGAYYNPSQAYVEQQNLLAQQHMHEQMMRSQGVSCMGNPGGFSCF